MSQPVDKPSTPRRQYLCVPCGKDRNPDAHGRCRVCGVPFARAAWPDVEFTMPLDDKEYDLAGPLIQSGARIPIKTACTFCAAYPCEDGKPYCANCKASFEDGSMAKRWPPPSQEARAAAHGITRTK